MAAIRNIDLDIFITRVISAACLFLLISAANVCVDTVNNVILVFGYRMFIILTPLLFAFFQHRLTFASIIISQIGLICWLMDMDILGTLLIASGLAVSGYMLKFYSSFDARGAAGNKIAISCGSILCGLIIAFSQNKYLLSAGCFGALGVTFFFFQKFYKRNGHTLNSQAQHFKLSNIVSRRGAAWAIIGFVIGVKLISLVSILPQFLVDENHKDLPSWYGSMIVLNSIVIICLQMPIMKRIQDWHTNKALMPLLIGMLTIFLSPFMALNTLVGAAIWTVILSLVECGISYLDKKSQDDCCLLIKESAVGIGCACTVFLVRFLGPALGSQVIGGGSIVLLALGLMLFYGDTLKRKELLKV